MIFLRRGIAFFFLSQIGTVADSRDLDLRKRASRFKFWAVAARKNCSRTLHSPQAHPAQSDLVLQLRKQCFYFPALALRCCEGRHGRPLARPLSRRFVDMDRDLPIVAPGALRFLRAIATALPRGHVHRRSIYGIDANVGEPLSFRTLIAVRLGNVGELLDPYKLVLGAGLSFTRI